MQEPFVRLELALELAEPIDDVFYLWARPHAQAMADELANHGVAAWLVSVEING